MSEYSAEIINAFIEETQDNLHDVTLMALFGQLQQIKTYFLHAFNTGSITMTQNQWKATADQRTKIEREYLFNAYEIIQEIRFRLTGEELVYHLYVTSESEGGYTAKSITVGGAQLKDYLSFSAKEISINASKVRNAAQEDTNLSNKYASILEYFKNPSRGKNRYAQWIQNKAKIGGFNKIIFQRSGKWAIFNRGHIIEALDKVDLSDDNWIQSFFGHLRLDSVSGFKGGDNGMVQVKANSARLMRYTSILNALDSILKVKQELEQGNIAQVKSLISNLYFSSSADSEISAIEEETINKAVDKLLAGFGI